VNDLRKGNVSVGVIVWKNYWNFWIVI